MQATLVVDILPLVYEIGDCVTANDLHQFFRSNAIPVRQGGVPSPFLFAVFIDSVS